MKYRVEDRDGNILFAGNDFSEVMEKMGKLGGAFLIESSGSY